MGLDLRWPIGLMFALIGALLIITGAANPTGSQSQGVNINLIWGIVLLIFAVLMLLGAFRGGKKGSGGK